MKAHHWKRVGGGDGFETLPDPQNPAQGYSLSQGGNLMRWDVGTGEVRDAKPQAPAGTNLRFNWSAALAVDPFEPATVWLGSQFVHRSKDRGETWETVSPDLTTNNPEWQKQDTSGGLTLDVTAAENYTTLVTIAPSPVAKGTIWTGSDDGRIHVTRDGGATWTSVESSLPPGAPKNAHVAAIEPSRHVAATAFAVLDNHRWGDFAPHVYRTDDFGKTWKSLVTPVVKGYALALVQDPVKRDLLFLGTETGLYASLDGGKGWLHLKRAIPTASVMDLVIHPSEGDLVIATHGRAIWILDDLTPFREMSDETLGRPLHVFTPGPARQHWRAPEDGVTGAGAADFAGASRSYGALITFSLNAPGLPAAGEMEPVPARRARGGRGGDGEDGADPSRPRVSIRVTDAAGALVRVFDAPARQGLSRVAWDLGRDAWRRFPRAPDAGPVPEWQASGPEVPPGDYTVTLTFRDTTSSAKVTVLPDPRSKNTAADWVRRWATIERAGGMQEKAAEAAIRIRRTRDDVSVVEERLRRRTETLRDPAERRKANETPLAKEADALKKALTERENLLWSPPEAAGISARNRVAQELQSAAGNVVSSWAPPSPTQLERLRQAEARLAKYLAELDAFYAKDVAQFREKAAKEGVGLLAP